MRLRTKILAIMAIPLGLLVATGVLALLTEQRGDLSLRSVQHSYQVKDAVNSVFEDMVNAETGMRGYLLTGSERFLAPYDVGRARTPNDVERLANLVQGSGHQERRVSNLRLLVSERFRILEELRAFAPVWKVGHRAQVERTLEEGRLIMVEIRTNLGDMNDQENVLLAQRQGALTRVRHMAFVIEGILLPVGILVALITVFIFARRLTGRLSAIEENAARLEQSLPLEESEEGKDEIGNLSRVLRSVAERIGGLQDELRRLAAIDPLTRLANRRGFLPLAEHQLRISQRTHEPLALVFVDVDGLKIVNDTQGHAVGDAMIAEAAVALRTTFRASDLAARVGGDEFCVLLGGESARSADRAVGRLRESTEQINREPGRTYELSLSVGIARFDPEQPASIDRLMDEADARMYEDKRSRRSRAPADERSAGRAEGGVGGATV